MSELDDKQEIYEVVLRYCRGVDRCDFGLIRSAYHAGALDHHTGFDGTVDEYIAWLQKTLPMLDGTMHPIGNHYVEFVDAERAISETSSVATHWGAGGSRNFTRGPGSYRLRERLDHR